MRLLAVRHLEMLFMFADLKDLFCVEMGKLWEPLNSPLLW
jgi:hypothetical protein